MKRNVYPDEIDRESFCQNVRFLFNQKSIFCQKSDFLLMCKILPKKFFFKKWKIFVKNKRFLLKLDLDFIFRQKMFSKTKMENFRQKNFFFKNKNGKFLSKIRIFFFKK